MVHERAILIRQVLDLQADLWRSAGAAEQWLAVDLTMPQLKVLVFIYDSQTASMGHVAGALGVSLSTVTGIVDRLVEHELVHREADPDDRRLVLCRLTTAGRATVERLNQLAGARLARLVDDLSVTDLHTVIAGLTVLCAAAGHDQPRATHRPPTRVPVGSAWARGAI